MRALIDHVILTGPDLTELEEYAERTLGVRPQSGGAHEGLGTRNSLLGLGGQRYLELVAPDPEQPDPQRPRPFRVDELSEPTLVGWALRTSDLATQVAEAREHGFDPGEPQSMSRTKPDGTELSWDLTPLDTDLGGVVPFLIDWGSTPHPSVGLPGVNLLTLRVRHPEAERLSRILDALDAARGPIQLRVGEPVRISVVLLTEEGWVELG